MKREDIINEMITMQRVLDKAIYDEHKVEFGLGKCRFAMLDEIGEFVHELKGGFDDVEPWCWWKKTQKQSTKEKVLEEFVDIVHFALSIYYHWMDWCGIEGYVDESKFIYGGFKEEGVPCQLASLVDESSMLIDKLLYIGEEFGFTLEDVYENYKKKNETNFIRLNSGY